MRQLAASLNRRLAQLVGRQHSGLGMAEGNFDTLKSGKVTGWARMGKKSPAVTVYVDGKPVAEGQAGIFRQDLQKLKFRNPRCGFEIELPNHLLDNRWHEVAVKVAGTGAHLARSPRSVQLVSRLTAEEFDRSGPWINGSPAAVEQHIGTWCEDGRITEKEAALLRDFHVNGYVHLPAAVATGLIDKLLGDVERAWRDVPPLLVLNNSLKNPAQMSSISQAEGFRESSFRYLDFHNLSEAGVEIMTTPEVIRFLELCFQESVIAMQSLLFENGTQQDAHQDFAFVHTLRPACLAGVWVALEDVHEDAGPLFYYPGSHNRVKKYDFGKGVILAEGDGEHVREFERYLARECEAAGLEKVQFLPRKGDVLIWSSALVHGGMKRKDVGRTRKSIVYHYTAKSAYPFDRRDPDGRPIELSRNGCAYYGWGKPGHRENRYRLSSS